MTAARPKIACFLGAGYSVLAGIPLAKDLLRTEHVLALSSRSERRFSVLRGHYAIWSEEHPGHHMEEYLADLRADSLIGAPSWRTAVEYLSAVIATAGTPPASLNRNPRYSNRINRPLGNSQYQAFWDVIIGHSASVSVHTTNYDILIERVLRHRPMKRPYSPGCFYGGISRPQCLVGVSQPFSRYSYEKEITMTGAIPVYKLHGSLSWSLHSEKLCMYQDLRAAFRNSGDAAIIPPLPEKEVPSWLSLTWQESLASLHEAEVWVICGYSMPSYDTEILRLLREGLEGNCREVFLLSPSSNSLTEKLRELAPRVLVTALPGLPDGIQPLWNALHRF
jgi:hypothetical protein